MPLFTFDLLSILNVAHQGVRRASIFLALGVNSARSPALSNYELSDLAVLQFVPSGLGEDIVANFKSEFERWVIGCGLRELVETFSVFLEHSHEACLAMTAACGSTPVNDPVGMQNDFESKGFSEKLRHLESKFQVSTSNSACLGTINKLRNCLTHRLGFVEQRDCNNEDALVVKWIGLKFHLKKDSGETIDIEMPSAEPQVIAGPGNVEVKILERVKIFKKGETVSLSPNELAEICKFFIDSASEIHQSCTQYAEKLGIKKG